MAPDSPFRPNRDDDLPADPNEGVRIIDPADAAEAVERGEAVRRKGDDQPKYGDRPSSPPDDVKPALRFPLSDAAASEIRRPRPAPVEPKGMDDFVTVEDTLGHDDPAAPAPGAGEDDRSDAGFSFGNHLDESDGDAPDADELAAAEVISVEPATGETMLPHWTAPPTGEVPRVIIGDDEPDDEDARWSSFASSSPRWRDEHEEWDEVDVADFAAPEHEQPISVDPGPMTQEEFLTFDDLEVPTSSAGSASPVVSASPVGSAADPIRIQSSQPMPTEPVDPSQSQSRPRSRGARAAASAAAGGTATSASGGGGGRRGDPVDDPSAAEPDPSGERDVTQAAFVGVIIAAVAVVAFYIGPVTALVLIWAIVVAAAAEFFTALRRGGLRPATLLGLAACAALPLAAYWKGEGALPLVLFLTFAFTILWYILGIGGSARPLPNTAVTLLGVFYVGFLGAFGAVILGIERQGVGILLLAIVGGVLSDVGGFFVGRQVGRTPLTAVSPNKTVEGLVGGVASGVVGVIVLGLVGFVEPFGFLDLLIFGFCVAVVAPLGDLAESLFKRDLGLKDMGSVIPGHGGVLDRFDGLLFVLPVAYYLARVLL